MLKLKNKFLLFFIISFFITFFVYFSVIRGSDRVVDDDKCDKRITGSSSMTWNFLRTHYGNTRDNCYSNEEQLILNRKYKNGLNVRDLLIVIKTTATNVNNRMSYIVSTWYQHAKEQIYAVTDDYSEELNSQLDGKLISTFCARDHGRSALCCKFGVELDLFFSLRKNFKWFCHVDDDNYLNIPNLLEFLSNYDHKKEWYFGRTSWNVPVEIMEPKKIIKNPKKFWFGTLGAGVCLSYGTMLKIRDHASSYSFKKACNMFILPDDMYLGYLLESVHKIKLSNVSKFNHHLDESQFKDLYKLKTQITLSFGQSYRRYYDPICNCTKNFDVLPDITSILNNDPYKMKSLHCLLYPQTTYCKSVFLNLLIKMHILNNLK